MLFAEQPRKKRLGKGHKRFLFVGFEREAQWAFAFFDFFFFNFFFFAFLALWSALAGAALSAFAPLGAACSGCTTGAAGVAGAWAKEVNGKPSAAADKRERRSLFMDSKVLVNLRIVALVVGI